MPITCHDIIKAFPQLIENIIGDPKTPLEGACSTHKIRPNSLCFAGNEKFFNEAMQNNPSAIVVDPKIELDTNSGTTYLISSQVELAMAQILAKFFAPSTERFSHGSSIHSTAIVAPSAKIGSNVTLGPYTVIGENVHIGDNTIIGPHCIIEAESSLGSYCLLHGHVFIGHHSKVGNEVIIHPNSTLGGDGYGFRKNAQGENIKIPHIGRVVLEDRVEVQSNCAVDRALFDETRIGEGTKLDNFAHIAHNVKIGKNCLITAGFIVAGSTEIGDNFSCGGSVSISDHLKIAGDTLVAGASVLVKSVEKPGAYGGNPLEPMNDYLKRNSSLRHLVEMRKDLKTLKKKLDI